VDLVHDTGGDATFIRADVSQTEDVAALVQTAVATYSRLDFAHNNAGVAGVLAGIAEYPERVWDRVIATNLKGVWLCLKYELPALRQGGGGAIVRPLSQAWWATA
jgi:NAD(P)-dependent dehydrogenase (short-subunit alcohol dehydrogenase family)